MNYFLSYRKIITGIVQTKFQEISPKISARNPQTNFADIPPGRPLGISINIQCSFDFCQKYFLESGSSVLCLKMCHTIFTYENSFNFFMQQLSKYFFSVRCSFPSDTFLGHWQVSSVIVMGTNTGQ